MLVPLILLVARPRLLLATTMITATDDAATATPDAAYAALTYDRRVLPSHTYDLARLPVPAYADRLLPTITDYY